jgi:Ca-activated chloride channel family protein
MHRPVCTLGRTLSLGGCQWLLFGFLAVSGVIRPAAYAQDCPQCPANAVPEAPVSTGEWLLTKQVTEVNVLFVALRNGQPVGDLSQSDLSVADDNKPPAAVLGFRTESDLPMRVGMVIDTSSSVTSRFRFEQDAASAFLRQALNRRDDLGFVLGFSNHPTVTQDFVGDPDLLSQGVARLTIGGGTALYDAIRTSCRKLVQRSEQDVVARVIVVLTDGQNNAGVVNLDGAIAAAQEAGVTIYAISTNYHPETTAERDMAATGNSNLHKLAEQTGGRVLTPARPEDVAKAFSKIGEELRSRYAISYKPADFKPDGHYRKIKIEARKTGGKMEIRARKGYYARLASSLSADLPEEASNVGAPAR